MKKIIIVLAILFLAVGGFFVYRELNQEAVIINGLDARAKEYVKNQSKNNDAFRYADFEGEKKSNGSGKVVIEDCFSLQIPFAVTHNRTDSKCEVTYGIPSGGNIIAYKRDAQVGSFDAVPGVSLRRQESEKYKEETKVFKGKTFLIFLNKEEQAKNAFYYEGGFYFVLNLLAPFSPENDAKFLKMLESVEFK